MMADSMPPMLLLPVDAAERIEAWGANWGLFDVRLDPTEDLAVVCGIWRREDLRWPARAKWLTGHYLRYAGERSRVGTWYHTDAALYGLHQAALARSLAVAPSALRDAVLGGWRIPPTDRSMPVMTWASDVNGNPVWSVWWVSHDSAVPGLMEVVSDSSPLSYLGGAWPVDELGSVSAVVIGVGSIGSVVSETLADYAVGRLVLVDPDRLLQHNLVRHRLGPRDLGRLKVRAMRDLLKERHPDLEVEAHPLDVIFEADQVRPLLSGVDVIVGATDGVASRRVVNHLARRAGVPAILACVLENGALGEIIRLRPGSGCLLCYRSRLDAEGALDPEPELDQEYGLGSPHLPMTAVAGDLAAVGTLAAKAAVSTVLESRGRWAQRLPGDVAVVGLQPVPGLPQPFDVERSSEVRWVDLGPSKSGCLTCAAP